MATVQDIHICGGCRLEFSDILKFIAHKEQCSSSSRTPRFNAQNLLKGKSQHFLTQFLQQHSTPIEVSQECEVGSKLQQQTECATPQFNYNSTISDGLLSTMVGPVLPHLSVPFSSVDHNLVSNSNHKNLITWQVKERTKEDILTLHSSVTRSENLQECSGENNARMSPRRSAESISFEDIAVYVVSPKSFNASGKDRCVLDFKSNAQEKIGSGITFTIDPTLDQATGFNSLVSSDQNCTMSQVMVKSVNHPYVNQTVQQEISCATDPIGLATLPMSAINSKYFLEMDLTTVSESSTPCPEDLEVGQISAAMLVGGSRHGSQRVISDSSQIKNVSTDSSYIVSGSGGSVDSVTVIKTSPGLGLTAQEYIRDKTASAPIIKDVCKTRRISLEKRERLQGVSDDLMSCSPYLNTETSKANSHSKINIFNQVTSDKTSTKIELKQAASTPVTCKPQMTSYKAVFTSPSCAGHRLNPDISSHIHLANIVKPLEASESEPKKLLSSVVYTNISASTGLTIRDGIMKPHAGGSKSDLKKVDRKITFDIKDEPAVSNISTDGQQEEKKSVLENCTSYRLASTSAIGDELVTFHSNVAAPGNNISVGNQREYDMPELHLVTDSKLLETFHETNSKMCKNSCSDDPSVMFSQELIDLLPASSLPAGDDSPVVMLCRSDDGSYILVPKENFSSSAEMVSFQTFPANNLSDSTVALGQHGFQQQGMNDVYINVIPSGSSDCSVPQMLVKNFCFSDTDQSQWIAISTGNSEGSSRSYSLNPDTQIPINMDTPTLKQATVKQDVAHISTVEKEKCIRKPKKPKSNQQQPIPNSAFIKKNIAAKKAKTTLEDQEDIGNDGPDSRKSKSFICKFDNCRYTTTIFKDFQRHYRRHTGERPFQCKECGKKFSRSDKLNIHMRWHSGVKLFKCNICDYACIEGGSLKKHMRIHNDERPFKCQICSYASRNSSQLIVHLRTHTGDTPFHCLQCSAKFKINSDLKRHIRTHTGEKPFQCDLCEYKSTNKGNLKTHIRINHSKENEISCPSCDFVTSSKKRLREHIKIHNSKQLVSCDQCDYSCTSLNALRNHASIHNTVKQFRCHYCPFMSKQSGNLKKHIQNLHLDKVRSSKRVKNGLTLLSGIVTGTKRNAVLKNVGKSENSKSRTVSSVYRKSYVCSKCGSCFVREDSLRCHMKQHNTEQTESVMKDLLNGLPQGSSLSRETDSERDHNIYGCQGIQHIVAAASKLNEENCNSELTPNKVNNDITEPKSVNPSVFQKNKSISQGLKESNPIQIHDSLQMSEVATKKSLPWEHRSYTLSANNIVKRQHPDKIYSSSAGLCINTKSSIQHSLVTPMHSSKRIKTGLSTSAASTDKSSCAVDNNIAKNSTTIDSPFPTANQMMTISGNSGLETFVLTQKGESGSNIEPTYSIQLLPQSSLQPSSTDMSVFAQELVGQLTSDFQAAQYQAGATKIQIVLPPGTTMFESSQAARLESCRHH
ncbi:zinc finger protein 64 isoforms 1 and 2 [Biomphalaria pfeifferi]|uniref:Zinc finger protein 64 isoforms 1 and 2 n=1 Tax=Biomphalaria pfeifferi TaxID=112525 RepID=A0AAD8BCN6_BIOPF|nr:zinc finger protein 64 isoforms 1 and 2 [Biomphalaria pfeifferi]